MNIDETKKNIETAKRIIGRETEEPGSIWFGIAKSMVGIAEWALGELGAVKCQLALTQGACTQHADAEFKARTERDALKLRLETQATAHNERERAAPLLAARHVNKTESTEQKPTTLAEAVAVCDGAKSTMQNLEDSLHLAIRTARVVHDRADGPADGTAVILGSLISAVELLARRR